MIYSFFLPFRAKWRRRLIGRKRNQKKKQNHCSLQLTKTPVNRSEYTAVEWQKGAWFWVFLKKVKASNFISCRYTPKFVYKVMCSLKLNLLKISLYILEPTVWLRECNLFACLQRYNDTWVSLIFLSLLNAEDSGFNNSAWVVISVAGHPPIFDLHGCKNIECCGICPDF